MRFLCLHGKGTNSHVLETQLGAVRYQLGEGHVYDFVEGTISRPPASEIESLVSPGEEYFDYFEEDSAASLLKALNDLDNYVEIQGPFDGVIGFSLGAMLAATLLIRRARILAPVPFKLAIFFSGCPPSDPDGLVEGQFRAIHAGELIKIPTAHVWGSVERGEADWPPALRDTCARELREEFVHDGGHEVPGSRDRASVMSTVQAIRRTVWRAQQGQRPK